MQNIFKFCLRLDIILECTIIVTEEVKIFVKGIKLALIGKCSNLHLSVYILNMRTKNSNQSLFIQFFAFMHMYLL